jgi:hypothetical protein
MTSPLSRREALKFGAFTTVGGVLTPGISMAQAIMTDTKGITARAVYRPAAWKRCGAFFDKHLKS